MKYCKPHQEFSNETAFLPLWGAKAECSGWRGKIVSFPVKDSILIRFTYLLFLVLWCSAGLATAQDCPAFSTGARFKKTSPWLPGPLAAMVMQPDGRIIMAGDFEEYNGVPRRAIVRVFSDGSIDPSFDPHDGVTGGFATIDAVVLQPDGKIVVSGNFEFVNGKFQPGVARLCPNGRLDPSFEGIINEQYAATWTLAIQSDGKIVVGGQFERANANTPNVNNIARFHPDGSLDTAFRPRNVPDLSPGVVVLPSGDLIVGSRGKWFLDVFSGWKGMGILI